MTDPGGRTPVPTFHMETLREVNCPQLPRATDSAASSCGWRQGHGTGRGLAAPLSADLPEYLEMTAHGRTHRCRGFVFRLLDLSLMSHSLDGQ